MYRIPNLAAAQSAAFAIEYCNHLLSPCMMPDLPDISSPQPTFTWTGGEDISDCYKSSFQVQPSAKSSSNALASHYEIMTASRDKDYDVNAVEDAYFTLQADSHNTANRKRLR